MMFVRQPQGSRSGALHRTAGATDLCKPELFLNSTPLGSVEDIKRPVKVVKMRILWADRMPVSKARHKIATSTHHEFRFKKKLSHFSNS